MTEQNYDIPKIDFLSLLPNIPTSYGGGIGDAVIQTHLPKNIFNKYGLLSNVWCPNKFWDIWQFNPFVKTIIKDCLPPFKRLNGLFVPYVKGMINYCSSWGAMYEMADIESKGDLYLSEHEYKWIGKKMASINNKKQFRIAIQVYDGTPSKTCGLSIADWNLLVEQLKKNNFVYQVGYNREIPFNLKANQELRFIGCDFPFWHGKDSIRPLMASIGIADLYIGVDTGGMHIATAFGKSVIELSTEYGLIFGWIYPQNFNILFGEACKNDCCKSFKHLSIFEIAALVEHIKQRKCKDV